MCVFFAKFFKVFGPFFWPIFFSTFLAESGNSTNFIFFFRNWKRKFQKFDHTSSSQKKSGWGVRGVGFQGHAGGDGFIYRDICHIIFYIYLRCLMPPLGWRFVQVQARVWYACTVCSYKNVQKDRVIIIIFLLAFFRGTWAWFAWFIFHCFCSNSVNFYRIKINFNVFWEPLKNPRLWSHFCYSAMASCAVSGVFM